MIYQEEGKKRISCLHVYDNKIIRFVFKNKMYYL